MHNQQSTMNCIQEYTNYINSILDEWKDARDKIASNTRQIADLCTENQKQEAIFKELGKKLHSEEQKCFEILERVQTLQSDIQQSVQSVKLVEYELKRTLATDAGIHKYRFGT